MKSELKRCRQTDSQTDVDSLSLSSEYCARNVSMRGKTMP